MAIQNPKIIEFILDQSGSMDNCKAATISGFNEYVGNLQREGLPVLMNLTLFNSYEKRRVYEDVVIDNVQKLNEDTFVPNGQTPLYDAIGEALQRREESLKEQAQFLVEVPPILCVIMTDGHENDSKEFNHGQIFNLIKQKEALGWTFAYLGSNQDAWEVGGSLGVPVTNTLSYGSSPAATTKAYKTLSDATISYSAVVMSGTPVTNLFNQDDQDIVPESSVTVASSNSPLAKPKRKYTKKSPKWTK